MGSYYRGEDFIRLAGHRVDAGVNFNWGTNAPDITSDFNLDHFSIEWAGWVLPQYTQTYTFYVTADDTARLYVGGSLIFDGWLQNTNTERSGIIALTAGQMVAINLQYKDVTGTASISLSWSSSSQAKQIIPASRLYPAGAPPPPPTLPPMWTGRPAGVPRLRGVMSPGQYVESDMQVLKSWNVNLMRWQMGRYPAIPENDLPTYEAWIAAKMAETDQLLLSAKRNGFKIVIDLHASPGGDNPTYGYNLLRNKTYQDYYVNLWHTMALRWKGNESIIHGYDILNEPHVSGTIPADVLSWYDLAQLTINTIRSVDTVTSIIVEGMNWGGITNLWGLPMFSGGRIIYEAHTYTPGPYTNQHITSSDPTTYTYPGNIAGTYWDKDLIFKTNQIARDFMLTYNVQVYIGEFSTARWSPGGYLYLNDTVSSFEALGFDWTYHAFREAQVWSLECSDDINSSDCNVNTDRKQTMLSWYAKNVSPYP
eukprot:Phypoly_transcript_06105.p1 GENE.Phypoly_transcript_06105~~Phypoly_transcript_06105.p1  ORF type:complete len:540 (+),score=81.67 Phypoly_transcript_06105:182-1621(+)